MTGRGASGMDTEYRSRLVAHLLALKDAPNTTLLDPVQAIGVGVTAARHMLFDKAVRLRHTDQQTAMECAALVNRIDALIRNASRLKVSQDLALSPSTIGEGSCPGRARSCPP
jgi:hypothetical protein